jgi:phosphate transport system protein
MMGDPRTATARTHFMFSVKNLERSGDHATNIAEVMHYVSTGAPSTGAHRPSSDALLNTPHR